MSNDTPKPEDEPTSPETGLDQGMMKALTAALLPKILEMFGQSGDPVIDEARRRMQEVRSSTRAADKSEDAADKARTKLDRRRAELEKMEAELLEIRARREAREQRRIHQGVKASVETVPTPVRLEVTQTKLLRLLAQRSNTTASAIIRDIVAEYIDDKLLTDKAFFQAAEALGLLQDR